MTAEILRDHATAARIHPGVLAAAAIAGETVCGMVRERAASDFAPLDPLRGLRLDAADVEHLLARPSAVVTGRPVHNRLARFTPSAAMADSPLDIARTELGLDPFELAVIALCLLPELDGRYGPLIGYLHDDVKRKDPSIELALALFAPEGAAGLEYLRYLTPESTLCAWRLIDVPREQALIRRPLRLDESFLWFLLGERDLDPDIDDVAAMLNPGQFNNSTVPPGLMTTRARGEAARPVLLYGEDEQTCIEAAAAAAELAGRVLLVIDGSKVAETESGPVTLRRCLREALLKGWTPCVTGASDLLRQRQTGRVSSYRRLLLEYPRAVFLVAGGGDSAVALAGRDLAPVAVPAPRVVERLDHWRRAVEARDIAADDGTLRALAETTGLVGAAIEEVASVAVITAAAHGEMADGRHVQQAARAALRQRGASLALTAPRFGWDDLILPPDRLRMLEYLCSRVRYRTQVREAWGTGHGLLPGVTALFAGEPGTGKSMAAEVIANDLGLDLCRIDLAQVVSKYIGETEKHLARTFDEAERCGVVLVFDEADALFGKRSAVRDSHDRYANIETSYLLQRMERYRGLAVLTTNLRANMDAAFTRRITVSVDFPVPAAADRLRIWRRALADTPCDAGLDLGQVAERLEISGGVITNVAVAAAYLAAREDAVVDGDILGRALRWELQKMGRWMGNDVTKVMMGLDK